jgi:predicted unusual protein kinase regulating ubiquinone biosynthesis (AarF/ABC1/UbiB family)
MESAVEADLRQLDLLFSIHRRMSNVIDTREIKQEIAARIREELDYTREARHARLYHSIFDGDDLVRVPKVEDSLSTRRLLCLEWLDGEKMLAFKGESEEVRNRLAKAMFRAWWHPFAQVGIIHGDPHLGNYTVCRNAGGEPSGINLLDYGCIRIFPPSFVEGVIDLYHGLLAENRAQIVSAYETWGFKNLKNDQIDVLSLWARFIFGPLLDDRVRTIADGVSPGEYGRREAFQVHQALKEKGPVTIPREFVFMDRAAIGLGGVFLHLDARLNFHRLFNAEIEAFAVAQVKARQQAKLTQFGLP